ncbi:MAG: hypothetical protein NUV51_04555 [Sulfuricaulis sp.]|nr:hypothetical protein [Sulfuricaulis sp.]
MSGQTDPARDVDAAVARLEAWAVQDEAMCEGETGPSNDIRILCTALAEAQHDRDLYARQYAQQCGRLRASHDRADRAETALAEARQHLADAQSDFESFAEHHRATEATVATQAQEIERLHEELKVAHDIGDSFWAALKPLNLPAINVANPGQHVTEEIAKAAEAQREQDAQICEAVAAQWAIYMNAAALECAAAIRAVRTPQEPPVKGSQ